MVQREREAQERRGLENSANRNIRIANPGNLMRDNPAALIVNREMYDRMATGFYPDLFDLPQVVKVSTYSSEHGQITRDFVLDGMTRTKYVNDHEAEIAKDRPDFRFQVRDVTAAALQNRAIVPASERIESQQALTMVQYLRAVISPTVEHSQIAPDRIAAHLINGWENMVGERLAKRYSALAALNLLGNPGINISTDEALRRDLAKQIRIMSGETIEERVKLQSALVEMASIIRQTKLVRQEVARSAFTLVSTESPVIGGEKEARKQIYGLLHTQEVERKLTDAFANVGEREQMRDQLGLFISESFKRAAKFPNKEEAINVLGLALKDPTLSFSYVLDVFTSENPIKQYDEVREAINRERLTDTYSSVYRTKNLTQIEVQLIDNVGKRTILSTTEIQGLTKAIKSADGAIQRAEGLKTQLAESREQIIAAGALPQTLDEAMSRINASQEAMVVSTSLQTITRRTQELNDTLNEANRRINNQITIHKIGGMIDQASGDKLQEGYGPQVKSDIIMLVFGEFKELNEKNLVQVRQRVKELTSLDQDLLLRVKSGGIRLHVALQRQNERRRLSELTTAIPAAPPLLALLV